MLLFQFTAVTAYQPFHCLLKCSHVHIILERSSFLGITIVHVFPLDIDTQSFESTQLTERVHPVHVEFLLSALKNSVYNLIEFVFNL